MWFLFPLVPVAATALFKAFGSKAITAELIGTELSSGLGYAPGEGPLSAPHPMDVVPTGARSELGTNMHELACHYPEILGQFVGKTFWFTASEELEALELRKAVLVAISKSEGCAPIMAQAALDARREDISDETRRQLEDMFLEYRSAKRAADYFAQVSLAPLVSFLEKFPARRVTEVQ